MRNAAILPVLKVYDKRYFLDSLCCFDQDKIAIPDFGTGAMENWGLITYRETNLLYDENQSSSYNKQRVASVIAHELVHQVTGTYPFLTHKQDMFFHFVVLNISGT